MHFIPYANYSYSSEFTREEIISKIREITDSEKLFRNLFWDRDKIKFEGEIHNDTFKILTISRSPIVIEGFVKPTDNFSTVGLVISITLLNEILIFLCLLFSVFGLLGMFVFKNNMILFLFPGFLTLINTFFILINFNIQMNKVLQIVQKELRLT